MTRFQADQIKARPGLGVPVASRQPMDVPLPDGLIQACLVEKGRLLFGRDEASEDVPRHVPGRGFRDEKDRNGNQQHRQEKQKEPSD